MKNTTALSYLNSYIAALRSIKVDGRLFADLPAQQAYFRGKAMECLTQLGDILNWSEVARLAGIERTRLQDIQRGKSRADAADFQRIHDVLAKHFA